LRTKEQGTHLTLNEHDDDDFKVTTGRNVGVKTLRVRLYKRG